MKGERYFSYTVFCENENVAEEVVDVRFYDGNRKNEYCGSACLI